MTFNECAKVETLVGGLAQELVATSNHDSQCLSETRRLDTSGDAKLFLKSSAWRVLVLLLRCKISPSMLTRSGWRSQIVTGESSL